ncbi:MAG: alpha-L-fucosidase [Nocardia sp.]|nr:alpha-L-fucosidase [Nocardia sp.]
MRTHRSFLSLPRRIGRWVIRGAVVVVATVLLAAAIFGLGTWLWRRADDAKAVMTTTGPYTADLESLRSHPLPTWFQDAELGIMVHWGPYSVPGFAPTGRTFVQMLQDDYDHAMTRGPYAEDYANQIKDPGSPTAAFHRETYGEATYADLAERFETELADWNPQA